MWWKLVGYINNGTEKIVLIQIKIYFQNECGYYFII